MDALFENLSVKLISSSLLQGFSWVWGMGFSWYVHLDNSVAFVVDLPEQLFLATEFLEWALEIFAGFHIEELKNAACPCCTEGQQICLRMMLNKLSFLLTERLWGGC